MKPDKSPDLPSYYIELQLAVQPLNQRVIKMFLLQFELEENKTMAES